MAEQKKIPHATGDFTQLLNSLQTVVKIVDIAVRKAGITQLYVNYKLFFFFSFVTFF